MGQGCIPLLGRSVFGSSNPVLNWESFGVGEQQNTTERCSFSFETVLPMGFAQGG